MRKLFYVLIIIFCVSGNLIAQKHDVSVYKEQTDPFTGEVSIKLKMDISGIKKPASVDAFQPIWHNLPVRQWNSGTCWSFSAVSFFESELKRLGKGEIKLSEMYNVYYEYLDKTRRFAREKGNSLVDEGSESEAVINQMKEHGAVRAADYTGLLNDQTQYDHTQMIKEIVSYLNFLKEKQYWDEEQAVSMVTIILNKYMGAPPSKIVVDGKEMTPKEYFDNVLQLKLDDYISVMSFKYVPFYTIDEFKVPDNWWHGKTYYNVPLDEFYILIKDAVKRGYSLEFAADVSEAGKNSKGKIAVIPNFDIAQDDINQDAREFRFANSTTTDDHGVHCIGITKFDGHDWYLIKDSGAGAYGSEPNGYYYMRDDYVKLKILTVLLHKDAAEKILKKFNVKQ